MIAAGQATHLAWRNESGGLTFFVPVARQYVKWSPVGGIDLAAEAERLRWLAALPGRPNGPAAPRLVSVGADDEGTWPVTTAIPARSGVDRYWLARPAAAAAAIGDGLRRWHDTVPVGRCPFSWSAGERIGRHPPSAQAARSAALASRTPAAHRPRGHRAARRPAAGRSARRLPRGRLQSEHPDRRLRAGRCPGGPGQPRRRGPVGRSGDRHLERGLELRSRVGGVCFTPTASRRTPSGPPTTGCSGTSVPEPGPERSASRPAAGPR